MKPDFDFTLIQGRWAISLKAWLLLFIPAVVYTSNTQLQRHPGKTSIVVLIMIVSELLAGSMFLLADKTWMRDRVKNRKSLALVIATWSLTGLTRSTSNLILLQAFNLPYSKPVAHVLLALFVAPMVYGPFLYFLALNEESKKRLLDMEIEAELLNTHRSELDKDLFHERERLMSSISKLIMPGLEKLQSDLKEISETQGMVSGRLKQVSEEISQETGVLVRELSHELHDQPEDKSLDIPLPNRVSGFRRLTFFELFQYIEIPILFPIALILPLGAIVQVQQYGASGVVILALVCLGLTAVLLAARLLSTFIQKPTPVQNFFILAITTIASGAVAFFFGGYLESNPFHGSQVYNAYTATAWICLAIVVSTLIHSRLDEISIYSEFIEANQNQLRSILQKQSEATVEVRRQISAALHGPVLGRLSAASMALKLGTDNSEERALELLLDAKNGIEDLMNNVAEVDASSLRAHLDELEKQWMGLIEISWIIDPNFDAELSQSPLVRKIVCEIASEAVSNASRHGGAKALDFTFALSPSEWKVAARDNGTGPTVDIEPGIGSAIATKHQGSWKISHHESGGALVEIALPRLL